MRVNRGAFAGVGPKATTGKCVSWVSVTKRQCTNMIPADWKTRLKDEMGNFALLTFFFFLSFCALSLYRNLVLEDDSIHNIHYGYILFESLVLSKIILLGRFLKVGERFSNKPLVVPTVYKTIIFCLLVVTLGILEHFVNGVFSGTSLSTLYDTLTERRLAEIGGRVPLFFAVALPLFGLMEIDRIMKGPSLMSLFFRKRPQP